MGIYRIGFFPKISHENKFNNRLTIRAMPGVLKIEKSSSNSSRPNKSVDEIGPAYPRKVKKLPTKSNKGKQYTSPQKPIMIK